MVSRWFQYNTCVSIIAGVVMGFAIAIPSCYAGGAVTIIKDEKQYAPRGSYIPERRVKSALKKVQEHKATLRQKDAQQQEHRLQESEAPAPQSPKEK